MLNFFIQFSIISFLIFYFSNNAYSCNQIDTVPIKISAPGNYCLTKNLVNENPKSSAIIINSDNVSVDLQGHILQASDTTESNSSGIESKDHSNIEIKNGTIKHFMYGIQISAKDFQNLNNNDSNRVTHNITISNITFEFNTFRGVAIQAQNAVINHSKFYSTGGTTVYPDSFSMAIEVSGNSCDISQNIIKDFYPVGIGEGIGISLSSYGDGCKIQGNKIFNHFQPSLSRTFAIWIGPITKKAVVISKNIISGVSYAGNLDNPNTIILSDNTFNKISCDNFWGKEKTYEFKNNSCLEEDTDVNLIRAKKGDPNFLFKLGLQYHEGIWVQENHEKSYFYFDLAAKKGHAEALRLKNKYGKPTT